MTPNMITCIANTLARQEPVLPALRFANAETASFWRQMLAACFALTDGAPLLRGGDEI